MLDPKDEIKQKIEIAELIGEYLALKPSGSHRFKANCPFHSEKTPSFHVSSDRQIWHCFGCGEGGDCFSFVMKMEGMDFPEALIHLGQKTGVEIKRLSTIDSNVKQRLYELHDLAVKYYAKTFQDSSGAMKVRQYVQERGITPELVQKFSLGFSPPEWNTCTQFLLKRGYRESEIEISGLGQKRKTGSGLIDRFRERLMIPLRDQHGKTVGFTARILPDSLTTRLPDDSSSPKYINSPETPIYHKGQLLFGLDLAKRAVKELGCMIIVEGNLDVIASHKDGVENVVASSGTALTTEQLKLLGRYTKTIVFALDQDAAGLKAARRGITLARAEGFDARALILPNGIKDPDEFVQQKPGGWKTVASHSIPIMEFLITHVTKGKVFTNIDDKRAMAKELLPALQELTDVVEQTHWLEVIAQLLGVDSAVLQRKIQRIPTPKEKIDTKSVQGVAPQVPHTRLSKDQQSILLILGLAITQDEKFGFLLEDLKETITEESEVFDLYNTAHFLYTTRDNTPSTALFKQIQSQLSEKHQEVLLNLLIKISLLAEQTFSELSQAQVQEQIQTLFAVLHRSQTQRKRQSIALQIRQAEFLGNQEVVNSLLKQLSEIQ